MEANNTGRCLTDRRRTAYRVLAFAIGLLLVVLALFLAEWAVRAFHLVPEVISIDAEGRDSAFRLSSNPVLGYEMKENHRRGADEFLLNIHFDTNAHGQRDRQRTLRKPAGSRRILLLGDSVVQGIRTPDLEDTISRQLEQLLSPENIEVLNFGVVGYNTRAEAELLKVKGLAFSPDIVVLVFVENDDQAFNNAFVHYAFHYPRPRLLNALFKHFALFRMVALRWDLFRFRTETDPDYRKAHHELAVGNNNVETGLALLTELSLRHGFSLLIVVWPSFGDEKMFYPRRLYAPAPSQMLRVEQIAESLGLPVVRLLDYFRRDHVARTAAMPSEADGVASPRYLYTSGDGMHPNPLGGRVAARAIREALLHSGLLRHERETDE